MEETMIDFLTQLLFHVVRAGSTPQRREYFDANYVLAYSLNPSSIH